jgi:electron transfer flavoprotein-quinone oxidoreductase
MADTDADVIVVGAGPAGACAALVAARAGLRVILLERGPFAGSKNMYGGVVYPRILDEILPQWWLEAPVQRWVTRRSTMLLTDNQALTVDFRSDEWGAPPYNGATAYRPDGRIASRAISMRQSSSRATASIAFSRRKQGCTRTPMRRTSHLA